MKTKAFLAALVALLLFTTGCQEQEPTASNKGTGGGTLVSQEEPSSGEETSTSTEENSKLYAGKTLGYESADFIGDEMFPVNYELTVNDVQIFDSYVDSGIPVEDFWENYLTDREFILLDLTIKKTKGVSREDSSVLDTIECLKLANQSMRQAEQEGNSAMPQIFCYFSGYSGEGAYYSYWLDPGEKADFQVGWCLSDDVPAGKEIHNVYLSDTQGLALYVGLEGGLNGDCIELTE